jgi:hypothetical protein
VTRFDAALAAIDDANADDPNTVVVRGEVRPKEQAHAEMMTEWVRRLDPEADELQLIAARAHHLRRWAIPRHTYPEGRAGYLRWRRDQKDAHAAEVGRIMADAGYGAEEIERVQQIVRKERLAADPDVQVHEDALCLVFLETQFDDLAGRLGDEKIVDVLRKTLRKMSSRGIETASGLPLSDRQRGLLERAVVSSPADGGD